MNSYLFGSAHYDLKESTNWNITYIMVINNKVWWGQLNNKIIVEFQSVYIDI